MLPRRPALIVSLAIACAAFPVEAQHAGHAAGTGPDSLSAFTHVMGQAIPLLTRATPSAGGVDRTQAALTQAMLMLRTGFWERRAELAVALNAEGWTMPDGELNTGAYGEGFVDRRHPHTYVHELMLTLRAGTRDVQYSASAGRGFAPFGTDDPMARPLVKFPINHHLSQILERTAIVGAARFGALMIEGATFGGEEPTSPSSTPIAKRFGDSWSARATVLPGPGVEAQASYARVASPEDPGGNGLDQRKRSVSVRTVSANGGQYLLAEWAHTTDRDHDRDLDAFSYQSALAEGSVRTDIGTLSLRLEQTDRPEEERDSDPSRTARPHSDLSIYGINRWRAATVQIAAPLVTRGFLSGFPFAEVARLSASPRDPRAVYSPQFLYGTTRFWMLTAGMRLRTGEQHARMGRYGAALPSSPRIF